MKMNMKSFQVITGLIHFIILITQVNGFVLQNRNNFKSSYSNNAQTDRQLSHLLMSSTVDVSSTYVPSGVTVLKCVGITKSFTGKPQFDEISINLGKGQRIGLIGVNGAGKSTLLKCLAGIDKPDSGYVEVSQQTNVVYVDQEPDWGNIPVYKALFAGQDRRSMAIRKYYQVLEFSDNIDPDEFSKATDDMEEHQAWDHQTLGVTIAENLNIKSEMLYRDVSTLSGGERKRVGLSAALLRQPDVLLLDEPTNHLDMEALEWLTEYLKPGGGGGVMGGKGKDSDKDMTMLLVTHDRYFLEKVCSEILELDRASVYRYPGNYARYLELKEARLLAEDAETERAKTKLRREKEWMVRQPKARQAKSKAREAQFYALVDKAKGRGNDVKALELATPEEKERQKRLGGIVAEFSKACYSMPAQLITDSTGASITTGGERRLLHDFTYSFRQRDRIGIVGPNGVGKSTFLKVLVGSLALQSGTMKAGETVRIGYYEQTGLALDAEQLKQPVLKFVQEAVEKSAPADRPKTASMTLTVETNTDLGRRKKLAGKESTVNVQFEEVVSSSKSVSERDAMSLLSRFQFPSSRWYDRVGKLSGGERRRLQLLQILARSPNVLILDEPSNDLDLSTLSSLEEYLTEVFDGCLVVVSHDRFFMDRVAEHLFVFQGDGIVRDFQGTYSDYLDYLKEANTKEREPSLKTTATTSSASSISTTKDASVDASATSSKAAVADKKAVAVTQGSQSTSKTAASSSGSSSRSNLSESKKLSYNERKEMQKLERELSRLHEDLKKIQTKLAGSKGTEGYTVLAEWAAEELKLKESISTKEMRLLELLEIES